jgi:hypothetical protein
MKIVDREVLPNWLKHPISAIMKKQDFDFDKILQKYRGAIASSKFGV